MTLRDGSLIILGMPRSGASLLAEAVEAIGFALPGDPGDPASPGGNAFAQAAIPQLNDDLLARKGTWWGRIGPVDIQPDQDAMQAALQTDFGAASRIAVTDPRLTLLIPAWRQVLEPLGPLGALIALRHPGEAATSAARQHNLPADAAVLMWSHYLLTALEETQGLPRALILFPDWVDDLDDTLARIAAVAGVALPPDAAETVAERFRPDAVHGGQQLRITDPEIDLLAGDLFALTARHARDGSIPDQAEIAPFRSRFDALAAAARATEAMAGIRIAELQGQLDQATARTKHLAEEIQAQSRANVALRAEIAAFRQDDDMPAPQRITPPVGAPQDRAPGRIRSVISRLFGGATDRTPESGLASRADDTAADAGKPDIFILSPLAWDSRPRRPHHLATELARAGHRVFFAEPIAGDAAPQQVAPGIHLLRLPDSGRPAGQPVTTAPSAAMQRSWIDHFYRLADREHVTARAHMLVMHPLWWSVARHLSSQFLLTADCSGLMDADGADPAVLRLQQQMIEGADRVIVSSQSRYDQIAAQRPARLIHNGADITLFSAGPAAELPLGPAAEATIRVGYVGAIAEWFDTELLLTTARENPDFEVHLWGPVLIPFAPDLPNIHLHGEFPQADLPGLLAAMDVMIIPFRPSARAQSSDPIKFYDHAAAGKLTVATIPPELAQTGDLVSVAQDPATFAQAIRAAAQKARDPMTIAALRAFALENAWSYRAGNLVEEMERAPLLSVVIPAAGPAAPVLDSLQMLVGRGATYPRLEILLAATGSDPAALEELRAAANADPRIRLLPSRNDASRAAIESARGEYVLLLGPQARPAAGALTAMVRHLQRNPQLGLIGPLSDGATEALDPAKIARLARNMVTGHRGQWTSFPLDARFCAMFRRADLDRAALRALLAGDDGDLQAAGLETALAEDAYAGHSAIGSKPQDKVSTSRRRRPRASLPDSPTATAAQAAAVPDSALQGSD